MKEELKCGVCGHAVSVFKAADGHGSYLCVCLGFGCGRISCGSTEEEAVNKWKENDASFTLKPCPFCGGKPNGQMGVKNPGFAETKENRIWCSSCGATAHDFTSFGLAVEKWEMRIKK